MPAVEGRAGNYYYYLLHRINRVGAFWKVVNLVEGIALWSMVVLSLLLLSFLLDNILHLPQVLRFTLFLLTLGGGMILFLFLIFLPLVRKVDGEKVAIQVEKTFPHLNNYLINALQLGRERERHPQSLIDALVMEGLRRLEGLNLGRAVPKKRMAKCMLIASALLFILFSYQVFFPRYFENARSRFFHSLSPIPPLSLTTLKVVPGDALVLKGDDLEIEAIPSGRIPTTAKITFYLKGDKEPKTFFMDYADNRFIYYFPQITKPFTYKIAAGDAPITLYKISIAERPEITQIDLTYNFPSYTALKPKLVENASGDIKALVGTTVKIEAYGNKPLQKGYINHNGRDIPLHIQEEKKLEGRIKVESEGSYSFNLLDKEGFTNKNPIPHSIIAIADNPPLVKILSPEPDIPVKKDAEVPLIIKAEDDFGVVSLQLMVRLNQDSQEKMIEKWTYQPAKKEVSCGWNWKLEELNLKEGDFLTYYILGVDNDSLRGGNIGRSPPYVLRIISPQEESALSAEERVKGIARLEEIIKVQKENKALVEELEGSLGKEKSKEFEGNLAKGVDRQIWIRENTLRLAQDMKAEVFYPFPITGSLSLLASREMVQVIQELEGVKKSKLEYEKSKGLERTLDLQKKIITILEALLKQMRRTQEDSQNIGELKQRWEEAKRELEKIYKNLDEFIAEEEKIIEASRALARFSPDKFTPVEEKKLAQIVQEESKWGDILQGNAEDLNKLPQVDIPDPTLLEQINQIISDIEKVEDYLIPKTVEMAVPLEQTALDLAKQMKEDLQIWMPDIPDRLQWNMEEPLGEFEVPMADLSDLELEDLIGELMETEDDLLQEAEDITSAWADSLSQAGWAVMDGPISNFSAKGKTGNVLPNTSEITGRSGEGRSGKTSGELIQKTVQGLGGRKTPARITPDAYQKGIIEELQATETGGATGGGKISGRGEEGIPGIPPPDIQAGYLKLAQKQVKILTKTKGLAQTLGSRGYTSQYLTEVLPQMKEVAEDLQSYRPIQYKRKHQVIITNIQEARKLVSREISLKKDTTIFLPSELQEAFTSIQDEKYAPEYEELLKAYFMALSNPELYKRNVQGNP